MSFEDSRLREWKNDLMLVNEDILYKKDFDYDSLNAMVDELRTGYLWCEVRLVFNRFLYDESSAIEITLKDEDNMFNYTINKYNKIIWNCEDDRSLTKEKAYEIKKAMVKVGVIELKE